MQRMSSSPVPSPPLPDVAAAPKGSQAAEIALFASMISLFCVYHVYYFERHRFLHSIFKWGSSNGKKRGFTVDLWTTAIESRVIWAKEMIKQPHSDDRLLAMHTMRNVIIASTLMVTGIGELRKRIK